MKCLPHLALQPSFLSHQWLELTGVDGDLSHHAGSSNWLHMAILGDLCSGLTPQGGFFPIAVDDMSQLRGERLEQEPGPQMLSRLKEPGTNALTKPGPELPFIGASRRVVLVIDCS